MAQKTVTTLIDDLDGGTASETITFALDGVVYVIDLNEGNAAALRSDMDRWVTAGRRGGKLSGSPSPRSRRSAASAQRSADVRTWAKAGGMPVGDRGRIPDEVYAAYDAAHAPALVPA